MLTRENASLVSDALASKALRTRLYLVFLFDLCVFGEFNGIVRQVVEFKSFDFALKQL